MRAWAKEGRNDRTKISNILAILDMTAMWIRSSRRKDAASRRRRTARQGLGCASRKRCGFLPTRPGDIGRQLASMRPVVGFARLLLGLLLGVSACGRSELEASGGTDSHEEGASVPLSEIAN